MAVPASKSPSSASAAAPSAATDEFFDAWGATEDIAEARKIVDICMEAGLNFFDTADIYSFGRSETVLGGAIKHLRREDVLISTKATFRFGYGPNDVGSSRYHLIQALEGSLRRLGTDYVDVYHLHEVDSLTPVDETLSTLDNFVRRGKVRYIACSNFSGWLLMKSLSVSERYGWSRYVGHQVYYSLVGRDYEWELMPLALDQGVGALIWSPLGWGRLTGKIRRETGIPKDSRLNSKLVVDIGPQVPEEHLYKVVAAIDEVARRPARPSLRSPSTGSSAAPPSQPSSSARAMPAAAPPEPRRRRLVAHPRADCQARRRQRPPAGLSLLASTPVPGAQPEADLISTRTCALHASDPARSAVTAAPGRPGTAQAFFRRAGISR